MSDNENIESDNESENSNLSIVSLDDDDDIVDNTTVDSDEDDNLTIEDEDENIEDDESNILLSSNNPSEFKSKVKERLNNDSDDESDTDIDNDNFQKFNENIYNDIITKSHKEQLNANYDEVYNLCKINRNKNGIIDDDNHKTIPILSKYEKTKIIGIRTKQLLDGAFPLITIDTKNIDSYLIAQKELEAKILPFIIKRPLPDGKIEYWKIQDLEQI